MAPYPGKKKRRKKVKYKKVSFKISAKKKTMIDLYCKKYKSTPNKLVKKAINEYLKKYPNLNIVEEDYVTPNQMSIFDIIEGGKKENKAVPVEDELDKMDM